MHRGEDAGGLPRPGGAREEHPGSPSPPIPQAEVIRLPKSRKLSQAFGESSYAASFVGGGPGGEPEVPAGASPFQARISICPREAT